MTATTAPTGTTATTGRPAAADASLGELVAHATADLSHLLRQEIALAKVELKTEAVSAGKGAGMLGGAGVAGLFALVFLSISAAYGISWLGVPLGCAFFTVGLLYLLVAAALGLLGKKNLGKVGKPERTIASLKDGVEFAKHPTRTR